MSISSLIIRSNAVKKEMLLICVLAMKVTADETATVRELCTQISCRLERSYSPTVSGKMTSKACALQLLQWCILYFVQLVFSLFLTLSCSHSCWKRHLCICLHSRSIETGCLVWKHIEVSFLRYNEIILIFQSKYFRGLHVD